MGRRGGRFSAEFETRRMFYILFEVKTLAILREKFFLTQERNLIDPFTVPSLMLYEFMHIPGVNLYRI